MDQQITLFPVKEKNKFKAYMSSALTGFPNAKNEKEEKQIREKVMDLNKKIQEICDKQEVSLYLPQDSSNPASNHDDGLNPEEVYFLDRWRIAEADFMILNADYLSFGVGQEIEIASSMGTPTIIFYKQGAKVSRMIKGSPAIFVPDGFDKDESYIEYENDDDLLNKIEDRIRIIETTINFDNKKINNNSESFSKKLKDIRERNGYSYKDLSQLTGFTETFLKLLETEIDYFIDLAEEKNLNNKDFFQLTSKNRFSNPGLYVLESISKALDISISELIPMPTQITDFSQMEIYKDALLAIKPNIHQLFKINEQLNVEFYANQAAFDGKLNLSKEELISEMKKIINE